MWRLPVVVLILVLAACSSDPGVSGPPNPVDGLATRVSGDELTLRPERGGEITFVIADPNVTTAHLETHRVEKLPLRVTWRREDGKLVATTIADG